MIPQNVTCCTEVQSGVRQGCILLPILFHVFIGNVLHGALSRGRGRFQWTMTSFLKHLDCTNDICLLSHLVMDLGQMALDLEKEASRVGLKITANKTKVVSLTGRPILPICINGQCIQGVDQFVYLGSMVSANSSIELDFGGRVNNTSSAFATLSKIWKCSYLEHQDQVETERTLAFFLCCYMGVAHGK